MRSFLDGGWNSNREIKKTRRLNSYENSMDYEAFVPEGQKLLSIMISLITVLRLCKKSSPLCYCVLYYMSVVLSHNCKYLPDITSNTLVNSATCQQFNL